MSQQLLDFAQKIIDEVLYGKWDLEENLDRENIDLVNFQLSPDNKFNSGKNITIEVYHVSGDMVPQSPARTRVRDLFKIDSWIRVSDSSRENRAKLEADRAKILDKITRLIHNNQTAIPGLKIATLTRWQRLDELTGIPLILHNSTFITGEWFHSKE